LLIEGKNINVNVLILSMDHEIDVLLQTVETLLYGLEEGVVISILLNGSTNQNLRNNLERFGVIRYYESAENLGVAGGRVFLCSTVEFKSADVICILDNDVVVPRDYLRKMATHLMTDRCIGTAGAIVVDINRYYPRLERFRRSGGVLSDTSISISCNDVKSIFLEDPSPQGLYHAGINKHWFLAYLTPLSIFHFLVNSLFARINLRKRFSVMLKDDSRCLARITQGVDKIKVSNIAGCTQSFRRDLHDQIGNFDEKFSPYGLEDVDFNVRAQKAGYVNYTFCDIWLLHGTDNRHKSRLPEKTFENFYRVLTIFSNKHAPRFLFKYLILFRIFCNRLILRLQRNENAEKYFHAQLAGFRRGLLQLEKNFH